MAWLPSSAPEQPAPSEPPALSTPAKAEPEFSPYWKPLSEVRGLVDLSYLSQDEDDPYRGFKLGSGLLWEEPCKKGLVRRLRVESFLSGRRNDDRIIWSLGVLDFDVPFALAWGPARLTAKGTFGFEYRTGDPNHGFGVFLGIGTAGQVWLGRNLLLSVGIERQFAYDGSDNNQIGFGLRYVSKKLPPVLLPIFYE